jgi:chromosome segregation ATPase
LQNPHIEPDFGPYLVVLGELKTQMVAGQKAMKNFRVFFTKQQREIQGATETQWRLLEMTGRCKEYKTTVKTLRSEEKGKDEALAEKVADIEGKRDALERGKEEAVKYTEEWREEKEKFGKRVLIKPSYSNISDLLRRGG